ncbi:MAG: DUF1573 domain-containing protein [Duncaniella sp.]|nr:DUF1573 domain-containing protein [Duncaniella sp.]
MRRLFTLALAASALLMAQAKGAITFEKTSVDFGTVKAGGGAVTMTFPFTNTGDEPVGIVTVTNGGCGCTKPQFPQKPVMPGEKGEITVTFNPATFRGEVKRAVKVQTSAEKKRTKLTFSGVVIPK